MSSNNNNSGRKPSTALSPMPTDSARPRDTTKLAADLRGIPKFTSMLRDKVYRNRQKVFVDALKQNEVGRILLTDPHVKNVNLEMNKSGAPTYGPGPDGGPHDGIINLYSPKHPRGSAEFSAQMTHEALHKAHHQWAPEVYKKRLATKGTHEGWDNAEEEFTITGRDRAFPNFPNSTLHENRARAEMNLNQRNSHESMEHDLPHDMSAHEYDEHIQKRKAEASGVLTFDFGSAAPRRARPPFGQRKQHDTKDEKKS